MSGVQSRSTGAMIPVDRRIKSLMTRISRIGKSDIEGLEKEPSAAPLIDGESAQFSCPANCC